MQSTIHHQSHHQCRRTTRLSSSETPQLNHRLPHIFSGRSPSSTEYHPNTDGNSSSPSDEHLDDENDKPILIHTGSSFLAPQDINDISTYARLMHAYTTSQMTAPHTGTIPSYAKTMHAFTLNQMNLMGNTGSHREHEESSAAKVPKSSSTGSTGIANHNRQHHHKAHLQTTTAQAQTLKLKLPPSQSGARTSPSPTSNLNLSPSPSSPCTSSPLSPSQKTAAEETLRNPTNTPEPGGEGALVRSSSSSASSLPSGARLTPVEQLRACERELEKRFEKLGAVSAGGGVGVGGRFGSFQRGAAAVRDFAM